MIPKIASKVQEILRELFGLDCVPASLVGFDRKAAGNATAIYNDLKEKIRTSSVVHADETSWRNDGAGHFVWYAGNDDLAFFHIDRHRSAEVAKAIFGEDFAGTLVRDRYAAYNGIGTDWFDNSDNPTSMQNAVDLAGLIAELHSHPNLILWMAGHRHVNIVKAFVTDNALAPERGFWHVETSSLHDFPQQARLFEINLNSDYTISIMITNVDPAVKEGTPAWTARKYAVATQQIVKTNLRPSFPSADPTLPAGLDPSVEATKAAMDPNICSYNAELLVELSPAMKAHLQTLFP